MVCWLTGFYATLPLYYAAAADAYALILFRRYHAIDAASLIFFFFPITCFHATPPPRAFTQRAMLMMLRYAY